MARSVDITSLLAKIVAGIGEPGSAAQQTQTNTNLAQTILLRSQAQWPAPNIKGQGNRQTKKGPGVVSRIFDVLSRPNYAIASAAGEVVKDIKAGDFTLASLLTGTEFAEPEVLREAARGFAGRSKETFSDVLEQTGVESGVARGVGGFALDVATDPLTYVGAGAIKSLVRGGRRAARGLEETMPRAGRTQEITDIGGLQRELRAPVPEGPAEPGKVATALENIERIQRSRYTPFGAPVLPSRPEDIRLSLPTIGRTLEAGTGIGAARRLGEQRVSPRRGLREASRLGEQLDPLVSVKNLEKYKAIGDIEEFRPAVKDVAARTSSVIENIRVPTNIERSVGLIRRIARGDEEAIARAAPKAPVESPLSVSDAERAIAVTVARDSLRRMKIPDKFVTPTQQLRLYKNLLSKVTGKPDVRIGRAIAMLREAERYFESQGYGFKFWDGMKTKLTEVFDEMGMIDAITPTRLNQYSTGKVTDTRLDEALERIRARSAMEDTQWSDVALKQTTQEASVAEQAMSPAKYANFKKHLEAEAKLGLKAAQVSPAANSTVQHILRETLKEHEPRTQQILDRHSTTLQEIIDPTGKARWWVEVAPAVNHAIEEMVGAKYSEVSGRLGRGNRASDFLLERYAAHHGQKDLRPSSQDYMLSAMSNAGKRAELLRDIARRTNIEQRREAFKAAQGLLTAGEKLTNDVADTFSKHMESLASSTGIRDEADSVAIRAGMVMDDLNYELRRAGSEFYFTNKTIQNEFGDIDDYRNGIDWLKSWQSHKLEKDDPIEFLDKMSVAFERLSKKYGFLDELSARFGSKYRSKDFPATVGSLEGKTKKKLVPHGAERLKGWYFPQEVADQITRALHTIDEIHDPGKSQALKVLDKATNVWKRNVTIYAPSHHVRNLNGDVWLSWVAGVNNPNVYVKAAQVLNSQAKRYRGSIENIENLTSKNAEQIALTKPGAKVTTSRSGEDFTAEQLYVAANGRGLLLTSRQLEDIYGEEVDIFRKISPFKGRIRHAASRTTELRDHYVRMAHFIDAVGKSRLKGKKQILDDAAHAVRKWHPDGMDLTAFERRFMRRIFPFYSWYRKAIPLVIEATVMKPGKVVAFPKAFEALQEMLGIEAPSRTDPFPEDQLFPDWIKEKSVGPLLHSEMPGVAGQIARLGRQGATRGGEPIGGYTVINPSNPMVDIFADFGGTNVRDPAVAAGSMVSPAARIPAELAFGRQLFSDVPISYDPARYVTEQLGGPVGNISRITNVGIAGPTERGRREGLGSSESLINFLTALGLRGTGPYIKSAQFEERERLRKLRRRRLRERGY